MNFKLGLSEKAYKFFVLYKNSSLLKRLVSVSISLTLSNIFKQLRQTFVRLILYSSSIKHSGLVTTCICSITFLAISYLRSVITLIFLC